MSEEEQQAKLEQLRKEIERCKERVLAALRTWPDTQLSEYAELLHTVQSERPRATFRYHVVKA